MAREVSRSLKSKVNESNPGGRSENFELYSKSRVYEAFRNGIILGKSLINKLVIFRIFCESLLSCLIIIFKEWPLFQNLRELKTKNKQKPSKTEWWIGC